MEKVRVEEREREGKREQREKNCAKERNER